MVMLNIIIGESFRSRKGHSSLPSSKTYDAKVNSLLKLNIKLSKCYRFLCVQLQQFNIMTEWKESSAVSVSTFCYVTPSGCSYADIVQLKVISQNA